MCKQGIPSAAEKELQTSAPDFGIILVPEIVEKRASQGGFEQQFEYRTDGERSECRKTRESFSAD